MSLQSHTGHISASRLSSSDSCRVDIRTFLSRRLTAWPLSLDRLTTCHAARTVGCQRRSGGTPHCQQSVSTPTTRSNTHQVFEHVHLRHEIVTVLSNECITQSLFSMYYTNCASNDKATFSSQQVSVKVSHIFLWDGLRVHQISEDIPLRGTRWRKLPRKIVNHNYRVCFSSDTKLCLGWPR